MCLCHQALGPRVVILCGCGYELLAQNQWNGIEHWPKARWESGRNLRLCYHYYYYYYYQYHYFCYSYSTSGEDPKREPFCRPNALHEPVESPKELLGWSHWWLCKPELLPSTQPTVSKPWSCMAINLNKKLSYCWEIERRESMPRIAEMDVEMKTLAKMTFKCTSRSSKVAPASVWFPISSL